MTKLELIRAISDKTQITQNDVKSILDALADVTLEQLNTVGEFSVLGLGKLKVKHNEARVRRNPRTGENFDAPAKNSLTFKASKYAKEGIN